jgi:hypothetical protein
MGSRETWFFELVAVAQRWGCCGPAVPTLTKVTALDCSCLWTFIGGGNSLMIHNTKAEGTQEPNKKHLMS